MKQPTHQEKPHAGRPRVMNGDVVNVNIRMTREQREKLRQIGGASWVREQIDRASPRRAPTGD